MRISCAFSFASCLINATICAQTSVRQFFLPQLHNLSANAINPPFKQQIQESTNDGTVTITLCELCSMFQSTWLICLVTACCSIVVFRSQDGACRTYNGPEPERNLKLDCTLHNSEAVTNSQIRNGPEIGLNQIPENLQAKLMSFPWTDGEAPK